jgi:hypothetical protein
VNANGAVMGEEEVRTSKSGQWKVMLQPRVIMLCIAASIRHTGRHCGSECLAGNILFEIKSFRSKGQLISLFTLFVFERNWIVQISN